VKIQPWGDEGQLAPVQDVAVSVVIVCWNSAETLPICLQSLAAQTWQDFEVILIDNTPDGRETSGIAGRFPGLQLRVEQLHHNSGFAAASNRGARLAVGRWLALLNPDAFPEPDWLEQLLAAATAFPKSFFASRQIQVVRPMLLDGEGDIYYTSGLALRANYNVPHVGIAPPRQVFSACAAAALYPRDEFLAAGGFDEDFFAYHEDVDLGFRLRLRGLRCFLVQAAAVRHVGAASTGHRSDFAIYHGHRNMVWTYAKNMPYPWSWLYLPMHFVVNLVAIPYFILAGHGRAIVRAKLDALRGLRRALAKRRIVQAGIAIPPREVVTQMNTKFLGPLEGWLSRQWPMVDY
jgi:GT2 family glycosyltransferase